MLRIDSEDYVAVMGDFKDSRASIVSYDETLSRLVIRLFNNTDKLFLFIIILGVKKMKGCFRWNKSNLEYHKSSKEDDFSYFLDSKNDFKVFFDGGVFMIKGHKSKLSLEDFNPTN